MSIVEDGAVSEVLRPLHKEMLGWAPPEPEQYSPGIPRQHEAGPPWLAAGDHNGDGAQDVALLLCKGTSLALVVVQGRPRRHHFTLILLRRWPEGAFSGPGGLPFILRTRHPLGEVAYYAEGETTPKSGRLQLDFDGIELIAAGQPTELFYWDKQTGRFGSVTIAD